LSGTEIPEIVGFVSFCVWAWECKGGCGARLLGPELCARVEGK